MAVRKHKLELGPSADDYTLLSLVSDDPDYKLCWALNEVGTYHFKKEDDLELFHKKTETPQYFSVFSSFDELRMIEYRIIRNLGEEGYFLEELRNIDYLVHIQGEFNAEILQEFTGEAMKLDSVRFCVPADLDKIRNRERLELW